MSFSGIFFGIIPGIFFDMIPFQVGLGLIIPDLHQLFEVSLSLLYDRDETHDALGFGIVKNHFF